MNEVETLKSHCNQALAGWRETMDTLRKCEAMLYTLTERLRDRDAKIADLRAQLAEKGP